MVLTPGSSILVDINIPSTTLGLRVNATPKSENEGIVTSEFNLTSPGSVPLVLQIIPSEPSRVTVYVRRDNVPTSTDYDWLLTSWADTDNYTLYISADLTNVTHIYVGVKSDNNNSMSSITDNYYSSLHSCAAAVVQYWCFRFRSIIFTCQATRATKLCSSVSIIEFGKSRKFSRKFQWTLRCRMQVKPEKSIPSNHGPITLSCPFLPFNFLSCSFSLITPFRVPTKKLTWNQVEV